MMTRKLTDLERRAIFAKKRDPTRARVIPYRQPVHQVWPKIRKFPLRGGGGRARRNRMIVAGVSTAAAGTAAGAALAYGQLSPLFGSLVGTTGYEDTGAKDLRGRAVRLFNSQRQATEQESKALRLLVRMGVKRKTIRKVFGASVEAGQGLSRSPTHTTAFPGGLTAAGVRRLGKKGVDVVTAVNPGRKGLLTPLTSARKSLPARIVRNLRGRTWTVPGVSAVTRGRLAAGEAIGQKIERGSLWNVLGKGNLQALIEDVSGAAKRSVTSGVMRSTQKVRLKATEGVRRAFASAGKRLQRVDVAVSRGLKRMGSRIGTASPLAKAGMVIGAGGVGGLGYLGLRALRRRKGAHAVAA